LKEKPKEDQMTYHLLDEWLKLFIKRDLLAKLEATRGLTKEEIILQVLCKIEIEKYQKGGTK
jgi:hypothetical protein